MTRGFNLSEFPNTTVYIFHICIIYMINVFNEIDAINIQKILTLILVRMDIISDAISGKTVFDFISDSILCQYSA